MNQKRDIVLELLQAIQDIKAGKGTVRNIDDTVNISEVRANLHLSQTAFAALMGISLRTLQEWEQGRRKPTGPAISLLRIARKHPEVFIDL